MTIKENSAGKKRRADKMAWGRKEGKKNRESKKMDKTIGGRKW